MRLTHARKGPGKSSGAPNAVNSAAPERILDVAATLFWRKGYAATTTREISAEIGIQKASLYYHIAKKEDLLYHLCTQSLQVITARVRAAAEQKGTPSEVLRRIIVTHVITMLDDQAKHATMLTELRSLKSERRNDVIRLRDDYECLVRDAIIASQLAGELRDDMPPEFIELALLNLLNWTIFWYNPTKGDVPQVIGERYAELFLEGARPRR